MTRERTRLLTDQQIGRDYGLERNAVYMAYEVAFRVMFEDFDGLPRSMHQQKWYVGRRWNRRERVFEDSAEAEGRLLGFVTERKDGPRRTLRLITGRTGSGKTTFLNHFFHVYLPQNHPQTADSLAPIMIDCADAAIAPDTLEHDIDHRVHEALKSPKFTWLETEPHYITMWEEECAFDKLFYLRLWASLGPAQTVAEKLKRIEPKRADLHNFNRVRINYLIKRGITPIMVWDNLDHADIGVQRKAIQLARHKLSWMPGAKVIVAVREYTRPMVLQEIAPAAYQLSDQELFAPDVHSVLERRVESAIAALGTVQKPIELQERTSVALGRPSEFMSIMLSSLKDKEVEDALCKLSVDNVRNQIAMAKLTFSSGHMPPEMINVMVQSYYQDQARNHPTVVDPPARLSWRRFIQGLICGHYVYHRSGGDDHALVLNVYEAEDPNHEFGNSLCIPRILRVLDSCACEVPFGELLQTLESCGYRSATIKRCVKTLLAAHLIHSPQGPLSISVLTEDEANPFYVECTDAGRYYVRRLIKELVYIQHMSMVTHLEPQFLERLSLWKPHQVIDGVKSAAALIAQVHADEVREQSAMRKNAQARRVGTQFGFGELAVEMANGCHKALSIMQATWKKRSRLDAVDWQAAHEELQFQPCKAHGGKR